MDSVDAATTAIPDVSAEKEDQPEEPTAREPVPEAAKPAGVIVPATSSPAPANPWAGLMETGLALLTHLASQPVQAAEGQPRSLIQRDERTGETFSRIPAPPPEVVEQLLGGLQKLLEGFRR